MKKKDDSLEGQRKERRSPKTRASCYPASSNSKGRGGVWRERGERGGGGKGFDGLCLAGRMWGEGTVGFERGKWRGNVKDKGATDSNEKNSEKEKRCRAENGTAVLRFEPGKSRGGRRVEKMVESVAKFSRE